MQDEFLKSGGLAGWIQAICAIVALWAFFSWKDQELAKRKADLASQVLRDAYVLSSCIRQARDPYFLPMSVAITRDSPEAKAAAKSAPERIQKCDGLVAQFELDRELVAVSLSQEAVSALNDLAWQITQLRIAALSLKLFTENKSGPNDQQTEAWARRDMETLGVSYIDKEGDEAKGKGDIGPAIETAQQAAERALVPFIRLQ